MKIFPAVANLADGPITPGGSSDRTYTYVRIVAIDPRGFGSRPSPPGKAEQSNTCPEGLEIDRREGPGVEPRFGRGVVSCAIRLF